jgi:sterol desaturase/sphingolipid hydroxylase (fatty acid hydroxylase superfamily)
MSDSQFIGLFIGSQAVVVLMDLRRGTDRPSSWASRGFLLGVLIVYFAIQGGLGRLAPGPQQVVDAVVVRLAPGAARGEPAGWALALAFVAGLYVGGLVDYLVHRFLSHSRALFFTHEYHHLPSEVMLLMPGLAARPFAVVATLPVTIATAAAAYGTLWALGQPVATATPMKLLLLTHVMLLVTSHSSALREIAWMHSALKPFGLTTAREHLLHHTTDLRGNYANLTTVWDRVFGTYLDPDLPGHQGHRVGLAYDQDWLGAVTLGLVKLPASVRARFDVGRWCNLA